MNMKTIKYRFSLFLKQFRIEDLKVLMQFLEMIVNEYKNSNASKLFDLLSECSTLNEEENDESCGGNGLNSNPNEFDNEFDEEYDEDLEDDDFDDYVSMKYDNKFNKAMANNRNLMPNSFSKQLNMAKSKELRLRHIRMQKFRQEKLMKFQALRRKNIANSFNHQHNMNGFSSKQKINSLLENANTKSDLIEDHQFSNNKNDPLNNVNNNNFENEKTSNVLPIKSLNGCNGGSGNNNNSNINEISTNGDTSGSNKTNSDSLVEKNYNGINSNIGVVNENDEALSSENEFNYFDSNGHSNKHSNNSLTINNSNTYQNLNKYYNDLQHLNNNDEDDYDDSVIINDNDSNENEDFNLDELIKNEALSQIANKKRKLNSYVAPISSRPLTNVTSNTANNSLTNNVSTTGGTKSQFECVVCADVAFGNRYGCWVCEGCKEFFRRQREKNTAEVSQCVNGTNKCEINVNTRSVCKRCRFDKCLKAGMKLVGKYNTNRTNETINKIESNVVKLA